MKDKLKALVLNITSYRENDHLIQVIAEDGRLLSFVSRGSQKLIAKNQLMPFSLYEFIFDDSSLKTIFTLQQRTLTESYYSVDLKKLSFMSMLGELVRRLGETDKANYEDLNFVFKHYEEAEAYKLFSFFVINMLKRLGLQIYVEGCVECNEKKVVAFSIPKGGFLCANHTSERNKIETLKTLRHLSLCNKENILKLKDVVSKEVIIYLKDFLLYYNDFTWSSFSFWFSL